jgi:hypothetical protein
MWYPNITSTGDSVGIMTTGFNKAKTWLDIWKRQKFSLSCKALGSPSIMFSAYQRYSGRGVKQIS